MICFLVKFDDNSGISLFAQDEVDAKDKATDRRVNPAASVVSVEAR